MCYNISHVVPFSLLNYISFSRQGYGNLGGGGGYGGGEFVSFGIKTEIAGVCNI